MIPVVLSCFRARTGSRDSVFMHRELVDHLIVLLLFFRGLAVRKAVSLFAVKRIRIHKAQTRTAIFSFSLWLGFRGNQKGEGCLSWANTALLFLLLTEQHTPLVWVIHSKLIINTSVPWPWHKIFCVAACCPGHVPVSYVKHNIFIFTDKDFSLCFSNGMVCLQARLLD